MAKEIISESRLREIISEETARFKKKLTLETEKKQLLKKLHEMYMEEEEMEEEENMEEGLRDSIMQKIGLKDSPEEISKKEEEFLDKIQKLKSKGYDSFSYDKEKVSEDEFLKKVKKNGYSGKLIPVSSRGAVAYQPGSYGLSRLSAGGSSRGFGV